MFVASYFSDHALGYSQFSPHSQFADWDARREEVKEAFVISWDAYKKHAWGNDVFHPLAKTGRNMSPSGLGWIIVDSLDTMMLMNLTEPLSDARKWLHRSLTWDQDQDVNTFETTIRMLGGLLSAHYLSTQLPHVASKRDSMYLAKAIDLADRLLVAFDSNSGIPYASVNIGKRKGIPSHADGGSSSTAEAATVQLEMKYLSHLTGNDVYWKKAEHVMKVLDDQKMEGVEYLAKQYLQTGETIYRDMWEDVLDGIQKHLVTTTRNAALKYIAELPAGVGGALSPKMDHLVCFLPGTIAMGATEGRTLAEARRDPEWTPYHEDDVKLAIELMKTCWGMYAVTDTGLAPEIAWFNATEYDLQPNPGDRKQRSASSTLSKWHKDFIIKPLDAHNLQRPETVESLFMMYRVTGDSMYREWGWKIFQAFREHTMAPDGEGFTSLNDVRTVPPSTRDNMESFWLAETLKYLRPWDPPSEARGIFGGFLLAQSIRSAQETLPFPGYYVHSLQSTFIRQGSKDSRLVHHVERVADGRTFATRVVRTIQNDKPIFMAFISFQKYTTKKDPSNIFEYGMKMPSMSKKAPEDIEPGYKAIKSYMGIPPNIVEALPNPFDWRFLPYETTTDPTRFESLSFVRAPKVSVDSQAVHLSALAYLTDIWTLSVPHMASNAEFGKMKGTPGMQITLNHSIVFHDPNAKVDDWMVCLRTTEWAGDERVLITQRLWNAQNGTLLVSCTQEGLMRYARQPVKL
ncbi:Mannosyl-oligosaccharide 1,2-alpha-mannosidase [Colletotrichum sp. SAR11_239]|nr:Mannosyl-oligosaccharide 1,2-alpha-mannosidase [Colletotrichum sp. SAR11_239]